MACLAYLLYAGITRTFNVIVLITIISILINGLLLLLNKDRCPFTTLAEHQGAESGTVTALFLPDFIARIFSLNYIADTYVQADDRIAAGKLPPLSLMVGKSFTGL